MFFLKGSIVIMWLTMIPYLIGLLLVDTKQHYENCRRLRYFSGLMTMFSLSLILSLIWTCGKASLFSLSICFAAVCFALAVCGIMKNCSSVSFDIRKMCYHVKQTKVSFWMIAAILMILFQMFAASYFAHYDADDSFYLATATTSIQTNTVFQYSAYTGFLMETLPARYVLSPFPIFLAMISKLSLNMNPAIIAHMIFPALFISMGYLVYSMFASRLFSDRPEGRGIFLLLCSVIIYFSCYAKHLTGTVMLIRIWQGKAFFASVIVPLLLYECMIVLLQDDGSERISNGYLILFMTGTGACLLSSMAIALVILIVIGSAVISSWLNKSVTVLFRSVLCCVPQIMLGICYVLIR